MSIVTEKAGVGLDLKLKALTLLQRIGARLHIRLHHIFMDRSAVAKAGEVTDGIEHS